MKNKPLNKDLESELALRSLFEKSPIGIAYHRMVYDKSGKPINYYILEANSTYQKLTRTIDPVGKLVTNAFPGIEQDPFDWIGVFGEVAKTGKEIRFQQHLQFNDRWYDLVAYRNKPDHFVATFIEITDHRVAEIELQEKQIQLELQNKELKIAKQKAEKNEYELRKAQEIAHLGSWYLDIETDEVVWTEELYKMYGFDPSLPVPPYTEHMKLFTAESWEILSTSLAKTREQGIPYELELKTLRKDGSNGWMWVRGESKKDAQGKIIGLWGAAQDISDRKQIEETLKESEKEFRSLAESVPQFVWIARADGYNVFWNQQWTDYTGLSMEESFGNGWNQAFHPEDQQRAWDEWRKAVNNNEKYSLECRLRKYDGTYSWWLNRGTPIFDENGKILKWFGTCTDIEDIEDIKQIQNQYIETKAMLQAALDNSQAGIIIAESKTGKLVYANSAALLIRDKSPEQIIDNVNIEQYVSKWNIKHLDGKPYKTKSDPLAKAILLGEKINEEFIVCRDNMEDRIVWANAAPIYDEDGHMKYGIVVFLDVTDRKLAEEEANKAKEKAEESEANYRILVETMPDGVYKSTHAGKFVKANPAMVNMLGYNSEEELLAVDIKSDLYIEDSERDNIILNTQNQELGTFQLRKKDGTVIWVEDHGWYSFDKSGEISYHEGVMRDVTERIEKGQELIKAKEKAEESDRLKSAFLANMSHEIRTPMNGIMGFASLLKEPNLTGEEQQNYIDIIEKSGERMLSIINDIISISKIEAGMMEVNWQESNINEQIDYIYTFFRPEVERKGMQLSFRKSLPLKESIIKTDLEKVYAILTNLVKNAIKYSENGSIEFGYNKKDHHLEFYVTDTGIGIPEERQTAIFERFIQADITDKMARQGAGLGLSISKAYVEILGGQIWLESTVDKGSTFYFTLPYNCEKIQEKNNAPTPAQVTPTKKLKILIAEDDESSRVLLSIIVKRFGHESTSVTTGTEAVAACLNNPDIDLVIMDILMPKMDGYEATRQIRKFNKNLFIIAQTAYALEGEEEKAIAAGCNGYITKPIKPDELKQMIAKYSIEYLRKL